MRPLRLEISGFSAFHEPIEVDFSDADYFAFVGPTGAGKSSLIDALTFALYGSIPRLAKGAVLPIISQGRQEMRVRLDFSVGDREYTAVRVVRNLRAVEADARAKAERQRLDDLSFATEDSLKAARAQIAALTGLQERIDAEEPRLVELRDVFKQGREHAQAAERAAGLLEKIETPEDVATLATEVARAATAAEKADEAVARAESTLKERDAALAELPARAPLDAALAAHKESAKTLKALGAAETAVAKLEKERVKAAKAATRAEKV